MGSEYTLEKTLTNLISRSPPLPPVLPSLSKVDTLLAAGADVHSKSNGATALLAAAFNGHDKVVAALIVAGADVNFAKDNTGTTALLLSAPGGHDAVVKHLITAGADVDLARVSDGVTPLLLAAKKGRLGVAAQLVFAGADVNCAVMGSGHTALTAAARNWRTDPDGAVVELLIAGGADVHHTLTR